MLPRTQAHGQRSWNSDKYWRTFPAVVAQVKQGCLPSKRPIVAMRGFTLWFNFNVKTGTNIVTVQLIYGNKNNNRKWNLTTCVFVSYAVGQLIWFFYFLYSEVSVCLTTRAGVEVGPEWGCGHSVWTTNQLPTDHTEVITRHILSRPGHFNWTSGSKNEKQLTIVRST